MTQAWYQVLSMLFGYAGAAAALIIVLSALRKYVSDRALWRRIRREVPGAGAAGYFKVLSGGRRLAAGEEIRVPYEGTMGAGHSCDVCIPARKVHMRSAFFWMEEDGLHMVPLHKDGFQADGVPVEPGDEAVLESGAVLCVGDAKLTFTLYEKRLRHMTQDGPYVTRARRGSAKQGRGDGVGAPGRGEARRERRLREKQERAQSAVRQKEEKRTRR